MFTLNVLADTANLAAIKGELLTLIPEVKSSHRCEALGRGLRFESYASAREASNQRNAPIAANGAAFRDYLKSRGFLVPASVFYCAVAKVAIANVVAANKHLSVWGIGYGQSQRKHDGKWESSEERYSRFLQDRSELLSPDVTRPFLASLALLAKVVRTKTVRKGTGSYWVKHIAENFECTYPEGEPLGPRYVPNGVLIAAAIHAGFLTKSHYDELGYHSSNVTFNMSKPCLEDLDYVIRPDSSRSQDRRREEERRAMRRTDPTRWA